MMKQEIEKIETLEFITKHNECKKWLSEIETWESGSQFMRDLLLKFIVKLNDENRTLKIRTFHNDLDGVLQRSIEWLRKKINLQSSYIKFYFKKNHLKNPTDVRIQHDLLRKEVDQLRETYLELRSEFFDLIKPVLKKRRSQKGPRRAA
ncbi:MAG: hypothetical protein AB8H03_10485 [Saprospiraceae bacterium]